jgi:hypothetical protein
MLQVVIQASCQPVVLEHKVKVMTAQHLHLNGLAEVAEPADLHQMIQFTSLVMVEMVYLLVFPALRLLMEAEEQDKDLTIPAPPELAEVVAEVIFTLMEAMG